MSSAYLFVYGSLRLGSRHAISQYLNRHADFIGHAEFQGNLYKIKDYPGAVPSNQPGDLIEGDVFKLNDAEWVLKTLDDYEECGSNFEHPTEYVRKIRPVRIRKSNATISAWIYLYNWPIDGLETIVSGIFNPVVLPDTDLRFD